MQSKKLKQFMKKAMALSLATVMAFGVVACGQEEQKESVATSTESSSVESTETIEENPLFNTNGELPIVNEEITLKVLMLDDTSHPTGHAYTSKIFDYLTEKTGIKFEIESYVAEEMKQKLPLIMAGDDLPDIFWRVDLTTGDALAYGQQGKLLAMDDLIEEYGYYTKELLENVDDAISYFKSADGHIYGLPRVESGVNHNGFYINETWLDNLGLEHPETVDELYDVLVAFKEKDANGNGDPNDEIPMTIPSASDMTSRNHLMAWVGICQYWPVTGATFDADENGNVFLTPISEQYRYLLENLHKFYAEGLLDNEIFTQTKDEFNAKRNSERVGVTYGWTDEAREEFGIEQRALFLTSEYNDEVFQPTGANLNPCLFSISATTEYPEVCFLLGDYIYSEEISWMTVNGVEGESFEWRDKDSYQFTAASEGNAYKLYVNAWQREEWIQWPEDEVKKAERMEKVENAKVAFQNYITYTVEETDTISALGTDIGSVIDEHFVQFITGEKELNDDTWNEYVKLVESLGAEELTEVYQTAYDRFFAE